MNKRKIHFVYRLFLMASLSSGIILTLKNTTFPKYLLSYYTTQSNIFCFLVYLFFLIADIIGYNYQIKKWYPFLKGAVMITISVTAIIYLGVLVPNDLPMYTVSFRGITGKKIGNLLVHAVSPALIIGDYYFDEKGRFKCWYPFVWLSFPVLYLGFVYSGKGKFYSIGGSREFAYFFLDYKLIGLKAVCLWIIAIAIGMVVLGYVLVILDKKFAEEL